MAFEFSELKLPTVEVEFKPHDSIPDGEGVMISINPNYLSSDRIEHINEILSTRVSELRAAAQAMEADEPVEVETVPEAPIPKRKPKQLKAAATEKPETASRLPNPSDIFSLEREQIRFRAQVLGGVEGDDDPNNRLIAAWDVVNHGVAVPVCFESLIKLPVNFMKALYDFCSSEAAKPTKKSGKPSGSI